MTNLVADSRGIVRGKFTVPAGIPSGSKAVSVLGAGGTEGETVYSAQGTLERQLWQEQIAVVETRWQSPPPPVVPAHRTDPLAQTFTLTRNTQVAGVDLWFTARPTTRTRVQMRGTTVGFPNQEILAEAILDPSQIAVPPVDSGGSLTMALSGIGSVIIPAGITSVTVVGRGSGGVAAIAGVAPTFGSWEYAGVFPDNALVGAVALPFTTGTPPTSFSTTQPWTEGSAAITFTKVAASETDNVVEYRGTHPATGNIITLRARRLTLTSGRTAVAAQPGVAATFSLNGVNYNFPGAANGVPTPPAQTSQTIALSGTVATTLFYNVPDGAAVQVTHNSVSVASGAATRIVFDAPVILVSGVEYAMVVLCDDPVGKLAVAELGKFDANQQRWITSQPYTVGVLLSSSNASTWTAHQDRDMAFRLLAAAYTSEERTINLGAASVTNATDLLLMSYAERPASQTNVSYLLTLPDASVVTVSDGQPVQLPAPITGEVSVSAVLRGDATMAPVLHPGSQLVAGKVATTANYITRAIPAGSGVSIKVIFDAVVPSGAGVAVKYKGIDAGDSWATVAVNATRNVDDGFVEFTHLITGVNETSIQVQLILSGNSAARPRVRDLRVIVL